MATMRKVLRAQVLGPVIALLLALGAGPAQKASAVPLLQLYIEGATYDTITESWTLIVTGIQPITVWAIADTTSSHGPLYDVNMAVAYHNTNAGITIDLTPAVVGGAGSYLFSQNGLTDTILDPSLPADPGAPTKTVTDGSAPVLGDGSSLPSHDVYGVDTHWQEFALGDFTLGDSGIGDFSNAYTGLSTEGQINAYVLTVSGVSTPVVLHFDLYGYYEQQKRNQTLKHYIFAPLSHDATAFLAPEPASLILISVGAVGLLGYGWRRRRQRA